MSMLLFATALVEHLKNACKWMWHLLQYTEAPVITLILLLFLLTIIVLALIRKYRHRFGSVTDIFFYRMDSQYRLLSDLYHIYYKTIIITKASYAEFLTEANHLLNNISDKKKYRIEDVVCQEEFIRHHFSNNAFSHAQFKQMYKEIRSGEWHSNGAAKSTNDSQPGKIDPVAFTLKNYERLPEKLKNPIAIYMFCKFVDAGWMNCDMEMTVQQKEGLPNKTTAAFIAYEICNAIGETQYEAIFSPLGPDWERIASAKNTANKHKQNQDKTITRRIREIIN